MCTKMKCYEQNIENGIEVDEYIEDNKQKTAELEINYTVLQKNAKSPIVLVSAKRIQSMLKFPALWYGIEKASMFVLRIETVSHVSSATIGREVGKR